MVLAMISKIALFLSLSRKLIVRWPLCVTDARGKHKFTDALNGPRLFFPFLGSELKFFPVK